MRWMDLNERRMDSLQVGPLRQKPGDATSEIADVVMKRRSQMNAALPLILLLWDQLGDVTVGVVPDRFVKVRILG